MAEVLVIPLSTVSVWLKRIGFGKRSRLEPLEPPIATSAATQRVAHVDVKTLARISKRGAGAPTVSS